VADRGLTPPAARIRRRDRQASTEPIEAADRIEPIDTKEPIEPTENAEPAEPIENTEPVEPTDRIEPFDHRLRIESSDRYESRLAMPPIIAHGGAVT
jgi:hypothetical protein